MNDIELIFQSVKDDTRLSLTNTFAFDVGFTWDVPVIYGEKNEQEKFWLYVDENVREPQGYEFVFLVEYEERILFKKHPVKSYNHGHIQTVEQAIEYIENFMVEQCLSGNCMDVNG